jgi:hypothetical protein
MGAAADDNRYCVSGGAGRLDPLEQRREQFAHRRRTGEIIHHHGDAGTRTKQSIQVGSTQGLGQGPVQEFTGLTEDRPGFGEEDLLQIPARRQQHRFSLAPGSEKE